MRYWRAYRYVFDSPHWLANLAYLSLCILSTHFIPVIGQLLVIGYACDVAETLHRQGHDRTIGERVFDQQARGDRRPREEQGARAPTSAVRAGA